ncbi:hypothetical protein NP233_g6351 [Leucocoprinus birnbaumii]|uniref:Uncharacterized protein n=1 Tax=Leucocoprinus birnbaumii TaxID=56174 RepID=A0AAD5YVV0_9AGAR|nr:hypothetical protein NP233_g6351 [Leucocoprinus birnbaumii]
MKAKVRPQAPPDHIPWDDTELRGTFSEEDLVLIDYGHSDYSELHAQDIRRRSFSSNIKSSRRKASIVEHVITYESAESGNSQQNDPGYPLALDARMSRAQSHRGETLYLSQHGMDGSEHISFYPLPNKKHSNLAIRRGHKAFPFLKLEASSKKKKREDILSFDSIPTAFRGSPTTYCSPVHSEAQYPAPQNLPLTEMLANLREKCGSLTSRVSLPPDWFYRPRSQVRDITKLRDELSSESQNDDEWAFAESLTDVIDSFSALSDGLSAHSSLLNNDILDGPILSCVPSNDDNAELNTSLTESDQADGNSKSSIPQARLLPVRPSLISPASPRTAARGARKTVRFAEAPILFYVEARSAAAVQPEASSPPARNLTRRQKRQNVVFSAWIPPTPPLSVVRSLQSTHSSRISWSDVTSQSNSLGLPPPPPPRRPLSHRYPTTPKVPVFRNESANTRTLGGSILRQSSVYQPPPDIVGKSPSRHPRSQASRMRSLSLKGNKSHITKENLKISNPIPISAIPRPRQRSSNNDCNVDNPHVASPLRSIFKKFI